MGFIEALTILLIVLKLLGVISISWLAVFTPLIIVIVFYLLIWILAGLGIIKTAGWLMWWRK